MAGTLRLILALHNHQPVGNFDGVFEQSYQESYRPFLDVMGDYPEIPFALHTSGSLLEWLEVHRPEYVDRLATLVARNQTEIIGGAFYEPILSNIPRRDRIGQIRSFTEHLESRFQTTVRGMWMPERVWEQSFAGDLTAAGIRYTILDDHHFKCGGLTDDRLHGYYISEDEGRLLSVFPGSERLRYLIPFRDPSETIDYLRRIAGRHDNPVVIFGDDGEKFGTWPETYRHVYEERWLHRFLDALRNNSDWLKVTTPSEALDHVQPLGTFYIPDASYREMTEWVLESEPQQHLHRLADSRRTHDDDYNRLLGFVRGGFWRNFRVKYPESNEMYVRMLEISSRLSRLESGDDPGVSAESTEIAEIRRLLYRAQCNCSYWHGAFGGLYLPHLRNAVYSNLIEADTRLESLQRDTDDWVDIATGDYNIDARDEIRFSNHRLIGYLAPAAGGHLYELDVRACRTNLLATLNRRPEPYHRKVIDHAEQLRSGGSRSHDNGVASIHDLIRFKQPDLDKKIVYDRWPHKSLVDHFLRPDVSFDEFQRSEGLLGDFANAVYKASARRNDDEVEVDMSCRGAAGDHDAVVRKVVTVSRNRPGEILVRYEVSGIPEGTDTHFATEFNFAAMPGGASDRYSYGSDGQQLGTLDAVVEKEAMTRFGLVDEWLGLDVSLEWTVDGGIWAFPVETISQSESGFELVHQSVAVVPHWHFQASADAPWTVELRLTVDTSLARARQLVQLGERGLSGVESGRSSQRKEESASAAVTHEL